MYSINKGALLALAVVSSLTSGCANMGIGEAEYNCSGIPDGVRCMSTQNAYELTNDDDYRERVHEEAMRTKAIIEGDYDPEDYAESAMPSPDVAAKRYDTPIPGVVPFPVKKVLPLRTPAKVMRIAMRAWESKDGALHVPGYVYTEIEARRWMIGEREVESSLRIKPLQVPESKATKDKDKDKAK